MAAAQVLGASISMVAKMRLVDGQLTATGEVCPKMLAKSATATNAFRKSKRKSSIRKIYFGHFFGFQTDYSYMYTWGNIAYHATNGRKAREDTRP